MRRFKFVIILMMVVPVAGCTVFDMIQRPSVTQVAETMSTVKLGVSREEVLSVIQKKYKTRDVRSRYFSPDEIALLKTLQADPHTAVVQRPEDILSHVTTQTPNDALGFVYDAAEGNGDVFVFYDEHLRYVGFFAFHFK